MLLGLYAAAICLWSSTITFGGEGQKSVVRNLWNLANEITASPAVPRNEKKAELDNLDNRCMMYSNSLGLGYYKLLKILSDSYQVLDDRDSN